MVGIFSQKKSEVKSSTYGTTKKFKNFPTLPNLNTSIPCKTKTFNMKTRNLLSMLTIMVVAIAMTSCGKYRKYDNNEVIENTFTGNVAVTSTGSDPAGDFTGNGDNGTYSFAWDNSKATASANFDITSPTGSVQMIIQDKKGDEVLNETLTAGSGPDTFSGLTTEGKPGTWKVSIILTNFNGDGSYSIHPGN